MKSSPNIYDYKDPIKYLEDCFQYEKLTDPELSLRKWSSKMGFQSPDAFFKILGRKKNMSSKLIAQIANSLKLDSSEERYFEFMGKYAQTEDIREKNIYELVMVELGGLKGNRVYLEEESLFSHWANLAILSFCNLAGGCTRTKIQHLFIDDVSEEQIDQCIDRLLRLELIREDENGTFRRVFNHEATKNDTPKESVHQYYEQIMDLAKSRIVFPPEEREFQSSLMAIKSHQLPIFKDMIRHFKAKIGELSDTEDGDQVYQLNIQFFPMSKKIDVETQNQQIMRS